MKVKVKICGIQNNEDAAKAIKAGADYLGFIFAKDSTRAVNIKMAKEIAEKVERRIPLVGVFKNNALKEVNLLCGEVGLDYVQLHGDEDPIFCKKVIRPVIKSFGLSANFSFKETIEKMKKFDVDYYLIDREKPGVGDPLSVINAAEIARIFPLFFAGGLTPESVIEVVQTINPFGVDVISGVKANGKFDFDKMRRFVVNAKGVNV